MTIQQEPAQSGGKDEIEDGLKEG
ncbi:hypothetical protein CCACVL1_04844 [Corchorus capsularis]|uniref:Uncharacterized protein n=1 Tax=Corchorus capsularis TaxID=210143 RepID=A0A1R3JPC3_COCAP|nr:hypothetical protein CCACVL1_04844 [Corchorus capsularis]